MAFTSVSGLLAAARDVPLWQAVLEHDCQEEGISREQSFLRMSLLWQGMKDAAADYDPARRSASGLVGGDAVWWSKAPDHRGRFFDADHSHRAENRGMQRLYAADRRRSHGGFQRGAAAVLLPYQDAYRRSDDEMIQALYVAAGFGQVIAQRASISGAEGGCQAEVGSAAAMAAAALVHLHGGTPDQVAQACAIALKNLLGLVCDPVAGLVEVPCVKRNVIGAMDALACAELALAGVQSAIPCDEVIDAMRARRRRPALRPERDGDGRSGRHPTGLKAAECLRSGIPMKKEG